MEIDPLSPPSQALLDAERAEGASLLPSADALDRVMRRLDVTLATPLAAGSTAAGAAHAPASALLAGKLPFGAAVLALGVGLGVGGTLAVQGFLQTAPVVVSAPVAAKQPEVALEPAAAPPPVAEPVPEPRAKPPRPAPRPPPAAPESKSAPSAGDDTLVKEQRLLDIARAALVQKRFSAAREALDRHLLEYRDGALAEEREFLAIQVLRAEGRASEAEQRETSFRRRYPDSILIPALDAR